MLWFWFCERVYNLIAWFGEMWYWDVLLLQFWGKLCRGFARLERKLGNSLLASSSPSPGGSLLIPSSCLCVCLIPPFSAAFHKCPKLPFLFGFGLKSLNQHSLILLLLIRWAVIAGSWVFWNREAQRFSFSFYFHKNHFSCPFPALSLSFKIPLVFGLLTIGIVLSLVPVIPVFISIVVLIPLSLSSYLSSLIVC